MFAASLVPLLVLFGIGSQATWDSWMIIVAATLQFVASLLSLLNLKKGDWGTGWAIFRGAVYALGLAAAPALVSLGYLSHEQSGLVLAGAGLTLTTLSSLLAILVNSKQQRDELLKSLSSHPSFEG